MKAAIYLRVSPEGAGKESPIEDVAEVLKLYCTVRRMEATDPYIDEVAGEFTALDRLIEDVKAKTVDVVVTDRFNRLTKDRARMTTILSAIEETGARLILILQGIDSATPVGKSCLHAIVQALNSEKDR